MIKVSIIVPVYNVEKYLDKCLDSLVKQTLKDIEIIVVNDGSPDNSEKIILKYQKKYPELIKYIYKENGGQGSARNKALEVAKGKYIGFVDSDDWLDYNTYEVMYNKIEEDKSDIVFCDMIDHYPNKDVYLDCTNFTNPFEKTPSACNKLFKKSIIGDLKFFEQKIWYEDFEFTSKILLKNPKISVIHEAFYHCHVHENSTMNNNNAKKNLDIITCVDSIKKYSQDNDFYDEELFSYVIFNHILVTSVMRVVNMKSKDKKEVLKKLITYSKANLGDYKKYDYYKSISRNKKIIAFLNIRNLYFISYLLVKIKQILKK